MSGDAFLVTLTSVYFIPKFVPPVPTVCLLVIWQ